MEDTSRSGLFTPRAVHLALFFGPSAPTKALAIASRVADALIDRLSGEPSVMSLPPNAPNEVPRIVWQDKGNTLMLSLVRADLDLALEGGWDGIEATLVTLRRLVEALVISRFSIQRVGFVLKFGASKALSLDDLKSHYICPGKLGQAEELGLAWSRRLDLGAVSVNRWVRLGYSRVGGGNWEVLVDTSTLPEQEVEFSTDQVTSLLSTWTDSIRGDIDAVLEW